MTFSLTYRDTGSVSGHYADRADAIRDAVQIAFDRPDLSFLVGVIAIGDDGLPQQPFVSASDLLAANDEDAVAAASAWGDGPRVEGPPWEDDQQNIEEVMGTEEAAQSGLAPAAVRASMKAIEVALGAGEEVSLAHFGKFHASPKGGWETENPRTGERMIISYSSPRKASRAQERGRPGRPAKS
jgi:nucleoid DNA-binding protein